MKEKWIKRGKGLVLLMLTGILGYLNFHYTSHFPYPIRLLVRIPQVFLLVWLWIVWVGKGEKQGKTRWRFKNSILHYGVMLLGFIEVVAALRLGHYMGMVDTVTNVDSVKAVAGEVKSEISWSLVMIEVIFTPILCAPFAYSLLHIMQLFLRFNVWSYHKGMKYFISAVFVEDLFYVSLMSILR